MSAKIAATALLLTASCTAQKPEIGAPPASVWTETCEDWADWDKPGPPFRIHGDSYYVGTCGIGAILITGDQGHVLIDGGTQDGAAEIMANIAELGFAIEDVKIILNSHEHFDHVGGLSSLQRASGAEVLTSVQAADVLRSGREGSDDPQAGLHAPFEPVANVLEGLDPSAKNGSQRVTLGTTELTAIATPGHTAGALTWQWRSCDPSGDCRTIVYADSMSPISNDTYRFSGHPEYLAAFRQGIARVAALDCDILLTPHPSASGLRDKLLAGDFTSGMNCRQYAASITDRLDARLAEEAAR